jgi:hypothetical protein
MLRGESRPTTAPDWSSFAATSPDPRWQRAPWKRWLVPAESTGNTPSEERKESGSTKYRLTFAALLARVFQLDVSVCAVCQGKMKIIAFITDPASVRRYLKGEGLSTEKVTTDCPLFDIRIEQSDNHHAHTSTEG